ncbi:CHAT domain-containing protein [Cryptosporangium sp. NPDC051539]|uniref:CHAT domain-containing protein n=1 Tax=Cryptosporangium sp. NPDC051539 TaxID=3363962 RepID=UPI00379437C5
MSVVLPGGGEAGGLTEALAIARTSASPERPDYAQWLAFGQAVSWELFTATGSDESLADAVEWADAANEADVLERLWIDRCLILGHGERYRRFADLDALATAVLVAQRMVTEDSPDDTARPLVAQVVAWARAAGPTPEYDEGERLGMVALAHDNLARLTGTADAWGDAIAAWRTCAAVTREAYPMLAAALRVGAEVLEGGDLLDEAIELTETVLGETEDEEVAVLSARVLRSALFKRYVTGHAPEDLDRAIDAAAYAVATPTEPDAEHPDDVATYGALRRARYELTERLDDLDEAIAALRAVTTDDRRPDHLWMLEASLSARLTRTGSIEDARELLDFDLTLVDLFPPGSPDHTKARNELAATRRVLATLYPDGVDGTGPQPFPEVAGETTDGTDEDWIGIAALHRYERTRSVDDLDLALAGARNFAAGAPDGSPAVVGLLLALTARFERTGDTAALEEAITLARGALRATGGQPFASTVVRLRLAAALTLRHAWFGDETALDEILGLTRDALAAVEPDDLLFAQASLFRGGAFYWRYLGTGLRSDLDAAIGHLEDAVRTTPAGRADLGSALGLLGQSLVERGNLDVSRADHDRALRLLGRALESTPPDGVLAVLVLVYAGTGHLCRFLRFGTYDDLSASIATYREALRHTDDDYPRRHDAMGGLAFALTLRASWSGALADLEEALLASRGALRALPTSHISYSLMAISTMAVLCSRGRRLERAQDFTDAVAIGYTALAAADAGHYADARWFVRISLTNALLDRGSALEDARDLDSAADLTADLLALMPADHVLRPTVAGIRALVLVRLFRTSRDDALLDAAPELFDAALAGVHSEVERLQLLLGTALVARERWKRYQDPADARRAADASRSAATAVHLETGYRLGAALTWASSAGASSNGASSDGEGTVGASSAWAEAVEAYTLALDLLQQRTFSGARRDDSEYELTEREGLASDAARAAILAGEPDRALELLERGRGVLWAHLLDRSSELERLRRVAPELAGELRAIRQSLDSSDHTAPGLTAPDRLTISAADSADVLRDHRITLARRWNTLLDEVRALPGFTDFLSGPSADVLRSAAAEGPVVVVNVAAGSCHALLVTGAGVSALPLPGLTRQDVLERAGRYPTDDVLVWLWETIAEPVLTELGYTETPTGAWDRVWWCPTGPLTLLPLHAAGHHDGTGRAVIDRVVPSYTPTLRALLDARSAPRSHDPETERILVVALPDTPGSPRLAGVIGERTLIRELLPDRHTLLEGPDATTANVLDALPSHRWVHFGCHGQQDPADPSGGMLALHDGGLTIPALGRRLGGTTGELAVLSACQTATGGLALSDEAISVAAAMQFAGWRQVIGTLWTVRDTSAVAISRDLYRALATDQRLDVDQAARALHASVRRRRERIPHWIHFVHIGA